MGLIRYLLQYRSAKCAAVRPIAAKIGHGVDCIGFGSVDLMLLVIYMGWVCMIGGRETISTAISQSINQSINQQGAIFNT